MKLHPIQLRAIKVTRLSIVIHDQKEAADFAGEVNFRMQLGRSDFEQGNRNIAVGLRTTVKPTVAADQQPSFEIDVELAGQFEVDYSAFNFEDLPRWSEVNAPLLLVPYVREQVYGLALRAGVKGMMLPLIVSREAKGPVDEKRQ